MSEAREEAERRWPKGWDVEEGTWRDGAVNGFVLGAEWADQGKPQITEEHRPQRLRAVETYIDGRLRHDSQEQSMRAALRAAAVADQGGER